MFDPSTYAGLAVDTVIGMAVMVGYGLSLRHRPATRVTAAEAPAPEVAA